ncbi:MAG: lytic transglycosylase domain-containing protein [Actinobacteria bacterium]|nr:lytic transglycosylase domain-containing protein [Actinomycetota bacterium]
MDSSFARSRRRAAVRRAHTRRGTSGSAKTVRAVALGAGVFALAGALVAEAETPAAERAKKRVGPTPARCPIPREFRPAFVRAADESRLPLGLLVAVAYAESGMNPDAVSDEGAQGLLQLMPITARELSADPRDPQENVRAGARYLRRMLDRFGGDLDLALAAYNAGPSAVERAGGPPGAETVAYVANVRARADELVGCV